MLLRDWSDPTMRNVLRNEIAYRPFKLVNLVIVLLVVCGTCGVTSAEDRRNGGPTPSAEGAAVHFIDLKDGQTVPSRLTIRFGLREMGVAPAGSDRANSGHHHLLIDTELPPLDQPFRTTSIICTLEPARPRQRSP
jgi:Domain of unknown function (DUF4399)